MWFNIVRGVVSAVILVTVAEVSQRMPRLGALLLSLPLVSILAFVMAWNQYHDLTTMSRLARGTLVLVPLSLPFFVPLAFADHLGLGFWTAFAFGVGLTVAVIGTYLYLVPQA